MNWYTTDISLEDRQQTTKQHILHQYLGENPNCQACPSRIQGKSAHIVIFDDVVCEGTFQC